MRITCLILLVKTPKTPQIQFKRHYYCSKHRITVMVAIVFFKQGFFLRFKDIVKRTKKPESFNSLCFPSRGFAQVTWYFLLKSESFNLQNVFSCVLQKKDSDMGLERHAGWICTMTQFSTFSPFQCVGLNKHRTCTYI